MNEVAPRRFRFMVTGVASPGRGEVEACVRGGRSRIEAAAHQIVEEYVHRTLTTGSKAVWEKENSRSDGRTSRGPKTANAAAACLDRLSTSGEKARDLPVLINSRTDLFPGFDKDRKDPHRMASEACGAPSNERKGEVSVTPKDQILDVFIHCRGRDGVRVMAG